MLQALSFGIVSFRFREGNAKSPKRTCLEKRLGNKTEGVNIRTNRCFNTQKLKTIENVTCLDCFWYVATLEGTAVEMKLRTELRY